MAANWFGVANAATVSPPNAAKSPQWFNNGPTVAPAPIAPAPQQGFLSNVVSGAKILGQGVISAFTAPPAPTATGPFSESRPSVGGDIATTALNSYANTLADARSRMDKASAVAQNTHASLLQRGLSVGEAGVGALQTFFAPITAAAVGAEKIPILGPIATGINKVFSAIGSAGGDYLEGAVQAIPFLSQAHKDAATPLAREVGALGLQIAAGKAGGDVFDSFTAKSGQLVDALHNSVRGAQAVYENGPQTFTNLPVQGESTARPVWFQNDYRESSPIQMGPKAPETLPSIQIGAKTPTGHIPGYTYEPVEAPTSPVAAPTAPLEPQIGETSSPTTETAPVAKLAPASGTVTKAANDINATLVKQGFDALTPEEQSKYTPQSFKEQADHIGGLLNINPEDVKAMAVGDKPVPAKVNGQILFNTVEALATKEGDGALLTRLASSPLGKKLSEAGQTLGGHGYNDVGHSAVESIREVSAARQAASKTKGIDHPAEVAKDATMFKSEVKAARSSRQSWSDLAKQIVCNI